jgi:predicted ester cyclase
MSPEQNKVVVRSFVDAWNTKDLSRFDTLMATDAKLTVSGMVIHCDPVGTRAIAEHWLAGFPDYTFHLSHLIAEGDLVAALMPWSGTQTGPVIDLPPTGRRVHVGEIVIFRVFDGKIVEAWEEWDEYRMRQQLGFLPT